MRLPDAWRRRRLVDLLRSRSLGLATRHAIIFGGSISLLLVVVYAATLKSIYAQFDEGVASEVDFLANDVVTDGLDDVRAVIEHRADTRFAADSFYLLQAADGTRLAGSLPRQPPVEGWVELPYPPNPRHDPEHRHRLRGFGMSLPGGIFLMVARDDYSVHRLTRTFLIGAVICLAGTVGMAIFSGIVAARDGWHRVNGLNMLMLEAAAGRLDRRIAVPSGRDELDELAVNLNRMLDRLQGLMSNLQQVSTDIAHDLRTPLARLRQRLERVQIRAATLEDYRIAVGQALDEVDEIIRTFAALLRIAQIEAGLRREQFAPLDLSALLGELIEILAPVGEDRAQCLTGTLAPDLWTRGDRDLLTQLFVNVIENAFRHGGRGARVRIEAGALDRTILVVVSDDGPGIPAAMREAVFKRFVRLSPSRTLPGSGLGLSLVSAIADLHEARVSLMDACPGLRVELRLARAPAAMPAIERDLVA